MAGINTYLVLDDPLPSNRIPFTLGVLVLEPQRPLDLKWPYILDDSFFRMTQDNKLEPVNQTDVHLMLNQDCDASLKLALQHVFSTVAKRAYNGARVEHRQSLHVSIDQPLCGL